VKIANRDARVFVKRLHPFTASNLSATYWCANPSSTEPGDRRGTAAEPGDSGYVVQSYGYWPLFVCIHLQGKDVWFENKEWYSQTTAMHRRQTMPGVPTQLLTRDEMDLLVSSGYKALVKRRITE
jgi:hypothetical protein